MMRARRRMAQGVACSVLLLALALPSRAETALTVGKANATSDAIIPVDIGNQLGIFKKHGLDLKIIDFGGGGKAAQAMAAGSLDIEDGAGTEMAFIAKGAPMMTVCESTAPAPFLAIGVPFDSPIKSLDDLKGKTIGVSSPGSFSEWSAHVLARKKGWGENGVKTVALGGGGAPVAAAFKTHQIDAAIGGTSEFLAFAETKEGRLLAPVSVYEGNVASGALFASNDLIAKNPGAVRAFLAGWMETVDYMRGHKAETVKIEMGITHFDEQVMSHEYDFVIGMYVKDCRFDPESLATLKSSFVDLKLLDHVPDMSTLYTEAYLPQ